MRSQRGYGWGLTVNPHVDCAESGSRKHFISNMIQKDIEEGRHNKVVTRFPPVALLRLLAGHPLRRTSRRLLRRGCSCSPNQRRVSRMR